MAVYFMHLVDSTDVLLDPEGREMAPEAIERVALKAARDCMAGDVQNGRLDLRYHIDVRDEDGNAVLRVAFADAIEIIRREVVPMSASQDRADPTK